MHRSARRRGLAVGLSESGRTPPPPLVNAAILKSTGRRWTGLGTGASPAAARQQIPRPSVDRPARNWSCRMWLVTLCGPGNGTADGEAISTGDPAVCANGSPGRRRPARHDPNRVAQRAAPLRLRTDGMGARHRQETCFYQRRLARAAAVTRARGRSGRDLSQKPPGRCGC